MPKRATNGRLEPPSSGDWQVERCRSKELIRSSTDSRRLRDDRCRSIQESRRDFDDGVVYRRSRVGVEQQHADIDRTNPERSRFRKNRDLIVSLPLRKLQFAAVGNGDRFMKTEQGQDQGAND